ncbi:hypothetical protein [Falsibacillus albus]|uniref:Uncharacterized protein n=1 Tax=Falsibacillus albus TaxID=2478915 RepID=A0A3L7JS29_9BACI|nr:hypothetical protein [Falsibacillus albus]RLQ93658.1 hypothetical protein D9X91_16890 [Falsibacillus albus]
MKKFGSILGGIALVIIILASISTIMSHVKFYSFEHNKKVTTETKVVNADELWHIIFPQSILAEKLDNSTKYSLIVKEMRKNFNELFDELNMIINSPDVKVKITYPITTYKDKDQTIRFVSGKAEILEVNENGQWKDFNGTWRDLYNSLNKR